MTDTRFDLTGKVAVVTGAGANGGIGHAIALGVAEYGADVVAVDIDKEGLGVTGDEIQAFGCQVLLQHCDVFQPEEIDRLFEEVDTHFGRIDVLVNVPFASPKRVRPHELDREDWQVLVAGSATSYFLCAQHAIRRMLGQATGGSIINISSISGVSAMGRGTVAYSAAKAAVNQMTRELAVEYAARKIRVNCLVPAVVLSPKLKHALENPVVQKTIVPYLEKGMPVGRMLDPVEMVGPAVFLASDASAAVTGFLLPVDGGNLALNASGSHTW